MRPAGPTSKWLFPILGAIVRPAGPTSKWLFPILAGLTHCAQPIDAPSAFSEQRYVCEADQRAEFDAEVEACRAAYLRDGSCPGRLSFQGVIDSQAVMLDAPATSVNRQEVEVIEGFQHGMVVWSIAPYFKFRFHFVSLEKPGAFFGKINSPQSNADFINLEARGSNYLGDWVNETREVDLLTDEQVRFHFSTDLERGGHLDGCLHVFLPPP